MELKFVRQWKFSTRNNNHAINPGIARRALIIRSNDDFFNQDVVNDNVSDESDLSMLSLTMAVPTKRKMKLKFWIINIWSPNFGLDLEYDFV